MRLGECVGLAVHEGIVNPATDDGKAAPGSFLRDPVKAGGIGRNLAVTETTSIRSRMQGEQAVCFPLWFSNEAISTERAGYLDSAPACHRPNEASSRGQSTFLDPQPVAARRPWGRGWLLALSECRDQCVRGEQEAPAVGFVQKAVDENHPALNLARPLKPRR